MLAVSEPQKSQNIFHVLNKRKYDFSGKQERDLQDSAGNIINHRLIHNISGNHNTKTIYNGQNPILAFDVKEYFAATYCWNTTLKLWNLDTGKCLWTVDNLLPMYGKVLVKIVEDKIVFAGFEGLDEHTTTRIFDLKSGHETVSFTTRNEENESRICSQVCVIGKRIFTLDRSNISEWNLEGKCIRVIDLYNTFPASIFLGEGNFLVYISKEDITIHNLEKNQNLKVEMDSIDQKASRISCACLDGSRLICGITSTKQTWPSCCVIDLHKGKINQHYPGKDKDGNLMYLSDFNKIKKIIADKEWIYLANDREEIMVIDLAKKMHFLLGGHKNYIHSLALKDGMLISASGSNFFHRGELKFWDTKTLKMLASNELNSLNVIIFDSGKVFAGVEKSLIQWDYLASHEGEKLSAHSAAEIETHPGARNCIVQ